MAAQTFSHSQLVRCPIAEAPQRLADHFKVRSIGEPVTLDSASDDRVRLTLEARSQLGCDDLLFETHWSPKSGVPVPAFHGELLVRHFGREQVLMVIGGRIESVSATHRAGGGRHGAIACARSFLFDIQRAVETPLHRLW